MDAQDFEAARVHLGLSRLAFARVLGIGKNTATEYALGRRPIPRTVSLAISALLWGLPEYRRFEAGPPPAENHPLLQVLREHKTGQYRLPGGACKSAEQSPGKDGSR